jgi:hypothetical protein
MKGWIERLLSRAAGEPRTAQAPPGQLRNPTLDERVSLYLRAVHGKRDFRNEAVSDARDRILDAMSADIAEKLGFNLAKQPRMPSATNLDVLPAMSLDLEEVPFGFGEARLAEDSRPLDEWTQLAKRSAAGNVSDIDEVPRRADYTPVAPSKVPRSRPSLRYLSIGPLSITISLASVVIVGAGAFALFRSIDTDSSLAWFDKLQKPVEPEVVVDRSQKQSKAASLLPAQVESRAAASASPIQPPSREQLAELLKKPTASIVVVDPPHTVASLLPAQVESQAAASASPIQPLSPEQLAELIKRARVVTGDDTPAAFQTTAKLPTKQKGVADLVKRGRKLLDAGKIGDARVLLRIAAEANDATAAFVLATTYDPTVLEKLKGHDSDPDVAIARAWYQKAADLRSSEWLKTVRPNPDR